VKTMVGNGGNLSGRVVDLRVVVEFGIGFRERAMWVGDG